jgi:hypothetical protein
MSVCPLRVEDLSQARSREEQEAHCRRGKRIDADPSPLRILRHVLAARFIRIDSHRDPDRLGFVEGGAEPHHLLRGEIALALHLLVGSETTSRIVDGRQRVKR